MTPCPLLILYLHLWTLRCCWLWLSPVQLKCDTSCGLNPNDITLIPCPVRLSKLKARNEVCFIFPNHWTGDILYNTHWTAGHPVETNKYRHPLPIDNSIAVLVACGFGPLRSPVSVHRPGVRQRLNQKSKLCQQWIYVTIK